MYGTASPAIFVVLHPGKNQIVEIVVAINPQTIKITVACFADDLRDNFFINKDPSPTPTENEFQNFSQSDPFIEPLKTRMLHIRNEVFLASMHA